MEMTQEWILEFNKKCAEFLYPNAKEEYESGEINIEDGIFKKGMLIFGHFHTMRFHSDWNWIMEVVEAIEKASKYTIMNRDVYSSFDIGKHSIKFYFSPNNNYLLHLELRQWLPDEIWKHSSYKHHIIKEFDFKKDGKKAAVVQAINQFIDWYNKQKEA